MQIYKTNRNYLDFVGYVIIYKEKKISTNFQMYYIELANHIKKRNIIIPYNLMFMKIRSLKFNFIMNKNGFEEMMMNKSSTNWRKSLYYLWKSSTIMNKNAFEVNERRKLERRVFDFEVWNETKESEGITVVRLCV